MESRLQKPGGWQGTAVFPDSGTWAVFGFMSEQRADPEIWTEPVLCWVMAERRYTGDAFGTVFYGLSLVSTASADVYTAPAVCESFHDARGCHIGYAKKSLTGVDAPGWADVALQHMQHCRRRREAVGPG